MAVVGYPCSQIESMFEVRGGHPHPENRFQIDNEGIPTLREGTPVKVFVLGNGLRE